MYFIGWLLQNQSHYLAALMNGCALFEKNKFISHFSLSYLYYRIGHHPFE